MRVHEAQPTYRLYIIVVFGRIIGQRFRCLGAQLAARLVPPSWTFLRTYLLESGDFGTPVLLVALRMFLHNFLIARASIFA